MLLSTSHLCLVPHHLQLLAILLGSTLPSLPGIVSFSLSPFFLFLFSIVSSSLSLPSFFQHLFPRYERFVHEGGDADFNQYLLTLMPDVLAFLQDPDAPGAEPDAVPLRERRSGSSQAAQDKREQDLQAKKQVQISKLIDSPREPLGFQVPLPVCY